MDLTIERNDFVEAVAWAVRALPARPPVMILNGLLLETTSAGLRISGFDYETSARGTADATVAVEGRTVVAGKLLNDIAKAMPSGPVRLVLDSSRLQVTGGPARFVLPTMDPAEFPAMPDLPDMTGTVSGPEFASAVAAVVFAAARDASVPALTGVHVTAADDELVLAATDRYRLAVRRLPWHPADSEPHTVLIPAKVLADAAKAMGSVAEISMSLDSDGVFAVATSTRSLTTRLLEGQFPDYEKLLPKIEDLPAPAVIPIGELVDTVKRVRLVVDDRKPIAIRLSSGVVLLEGGGGEDAASSERVECDYSGEDVTISFNPGYFLEALGSLDSDVVVLHVTTATRPALLTGKTNGEVEAGHRVLVMPMRVNG